MNRVRQHLLPIIIAAIATLPGIVLKVSGIGTELLHGHHAWVVALLSGVSVLGASFLLLWACDAAQVDISQTLALAIVALIAVLPEYAVDMYITWRAAADPGTYAPLAIANMTGANRLIIGVAWAVIVLVYWLKTRKSVIIEKDRRTELFFLTLATAYAFTIPLKWAIFHWGLNWIDGIAFILIYAWYIKVAGKRPVEESDADGPAELLVSLPPVKRRLSVLAMFIFAAGAIAANAEQFSEGLIETGTLLHINKAMLIQWLAPIASEAPEFTVAIMFALRKKAGMALGSLLSSKLNQWTLLVGMIPWVYAVAKGNLVDSLPMSAVQMHEIMLTAAQSLLAIVLLGLLRLSLPQALLLFGLFIGQLALPPIMTWVATAPLPPAFVERINALVPFGITPEHVHPLFSLLYIIAAIVLLLEHPVRIRSIFLGARVETAEEELPELEDKAAEEEQGMVGV
jgi:cation:H+ antiporter